MLIGSISLASSDIGFPGSDLTCEWQGGPDTHDGWLVMKGITLSLVIVFPVRAGAVRLEFRPDRSGHKRGLS